MRKFLVLGLIVLLLASAFWFFSSSKSQKQTGMILHKFGEKKQVQAKLVFPVGKGPHPVVLFSPAKGMAIGDYQPLAEAIAQAGFLFVQMDHPESNERLVVSSNKDETRYSTMKTPSRDLAIRKARIEDFKIVLDGLKNIPQADLQRLAIAGHLSGGVAVQALIGARMRGIEGSADSRVKAALIFSPYGVAKKSFEDMGFTADSWKQLNLPVFHLQMQKDLPWGNPEQLSVINDSAYQGTPANGRQYFMRMSQGTALSVIGWDSNLQRGDLELRDKVARIAILFFQAELLGDAGARTQLEKLDQQEFLQGLVEKFLRK